MSVSRQLHRLQIIEIEIESREKVLAESRSQLGERGVLVRAQDRLSGVKQHVEELKGKQQSLEWEIDDLGSKIAVVGQSLYSGQIKNPKELSSLQHEAEGQKKRRNQLEDEALGLMEQVEEATNTLATIEGELKTLEKEWRNKQQRLSAEIERLEGELSELEHKQQVLLAEIEPGTSDFYYQLKKQRVRPVARVEQGLCGGCRLSLSTAELQRVKGSSLVQCSSCRRILFLD